MSDPFDLAFAASMQDDWLDVILTVWCRRLRRIRLSLLGLRGLCPIWKTCLYLGRSRLVVIRLPTWLLEVKSGPRSS